MVQQNTVKEVWSVSKGSMFLGECFTAPNLLMGRGRARAVGKGTQGVTR